MAFLQFTQYQRIVFVELGANLIALLHHCPLFSGLMFFTLCLVCIQYPCFTSFFSVKPFDWCFFFFFFQWLFLHVSLFSSFSKFVSLFSCPIFWFHFIVYMFSSLFMFVSLFSCPIFLVSLIFLLNHLILHCNVAFKSSARTQFKIGVMFIIHYFLPFIVNYLNSVLQPAFP